MQSKLIKPISAAAKVPPGAASLCLQVESTLASAAAASPETGTQVEQLRCQVGALQLALQGAQAAHGQALERMATMKVGQSHRCHPLIRPWRCWHVPVK